MNTTLTQSVVASFPDRPSVGGVGLLAEMAIGDQGMYITHDLGSAQSVIHLRFVLNPWGLAGGRCVLLVGLDNQDAQAVRLTYDTADDSMSVWTAGGVILSAQLDGVLLWQCVEIALDTVSGQALLWVNGTIADQVSGDLSVSTVQTVGFGVIQKDTALAGVLYLDELCIADSYIGPVVVSPLSDYADDPSRWLVVYNVSDPDAVGWAEAYRQARCVPFVNLAGLSLPTDETINATQYAALVGSISDYLSDNGLSGQVMGILLGYGVPGYVDFSGGGVLEAIPALLQTNHTTAGIAANPSASPSTFARLTVDDLAGVRMTARLDAHNLSTATQQIDHAGSLGVTGLSAGDSTIYFDPFVGTEPTFQQAVGDMLAWATGIDGMKTRLPIILSGNPSGNAEASFQDVSGDGVFWGWSSTPAAPNIFTSPAGRRAVCAQLYLAGASATTLRGATPGNWADAPIDAGYAATIASSRDNPVSAIPDASAFFNTLREGWTLGEAWHVAQPLLRSGFYLVGDPLMPVAMPKQGFEVYGPVLDLESLDLSIQDYVLPEDVSGVDVSGGQPGEGVVSHYMIRQSDALGRVESSATSVRVVNVSGVALPAVTLPVWPDIAGWPVTIEDGLVCLSVCWEKPVSAINVQTIELLSQAEGQGFVVAAVPTWSPLESIIKAKLPIAPDKTRYRWRFTSPDGVVQHTAWSDWIEPYASPTIGLQQIGATS